MDSAHQVPTNVKTFTQKRVIIKIKSEENKTFESTGAIIWVYPNNSAKVLIVDLALGDLRAKDTDGKYFKKGNYYETFKDVNKYESFNFLDQNWKIFDIKDSEQPDGIGLYFFAKKI